MASEKRLIDANALLEEHCDGCSLAQRKMCENDPVCGSAMWIVEAPTVDAVEVVHARWEKRKDVIGFVRCSACHDCNIYDDWADGKKWNYCPNCGAKMDGGNEDG